MGVLTKILGGLAKPLADLGGTVSGHFAATKQAKIEKTLKIATAKLDYKLAKLQAKTNRVLTKEQNDATYDMQVLRNREHTWADEFLIGAMVGIMFMHFIPYTQPYMTGGWVAMGYEGVPWWFEFVMIGIFVSTLGLMRLFRLFWTRRGEKEAKRPPDVDAT